MRTVKSKTEARDDRDLVWRVTKNKKTTEEIQAARFALRKTTAGRLDLFYYRLESSRVRTKSKIRNTVR